MLLSWVGKKKKHYKIKNDRMSLVCRIRANPITEILGLSRCQLRNLCPAQKPVAKRRSPLPSCSNFINLFACRCSTFSASMHGFLACHRKVLNLPSSLELWAIDYLLSVLAFPSLVEWTGTHPFVVLCRLIRIIKRPDHYPELYCMPS